MVNHLAGRYQRALPHEWPRAPRNLFVKMTREVNPWANGRSTYRVVRPARPAADCRPADSRRSKRLHEVGSPGISAA